MTWDEIDAANLRIAKLLAPGEGWKVLEGNGPYFTNSREWRNACLMVGDDTQHVDIPDYYSDLNAVTDVLKLYDISLYLDFGPAYAARIIPEGRVDDPPMPEFHAGNTSAHETIQELAGAALLAYLEAQAAGKAGGG